MLNISENPVEERNAVQATYTSFSNIGFPKIRKSFAYMMGGVFLIALFIMFLPWTQNIQSKAKVVALNPEDQEQMIPSIISGRIQKWHVREGQYVGSGDTLVTITEIKDEYLDPELLKRTQQMINAKEASIEAYRIKIDAYDQQIKLLKKLRDLKINEVKNKILQSEFKVQADSMAAITEENNAEIANIQFLRYDTLFKLGVNDQTKYEEYRVKLQDAQNKQVSAKNKFFSSKNELINAKIALSQVKNEYLEKLAKAESERQSARSGLFEADAEITKLRNQYTNYSQRFGFYTILAPQDGYITKAYRSGVGETVKEGEALVTFVPKSLQKAVAMYVRAVDIPLISEGNKVRFLFDGWPAIFFSGWPNLSFGTFGGIVIGFDRTSDQNGKFRVLVVPDPNDVPWPDLIQLGAGAEGIALLNRVPVWYEIWRIANGFPPDFYRQVEEGVEEVKGPKIKTMLK